MPPFILALASANILCCSATASSSVISAPLLHFPPLKESCCRTFQKYTISAGPFGALKQPMSLSYAFKNELALLNLLNRINIGGRSMVHNFTWPLCYMTNRMAEHDKPSFPGWMNIYKNFQYFSSCLKFQGFFFNRTIHFSRYTARPGTKLIT